jgi:predicted metal-dependent peptidase
LSELEELFTKIRVDFLFSHPFLSVLALSLKHIWGENANYPVLTDGRAIYLDGNKLSEYSPDEIKYLYAHVLLHVALKHPFRQKTKDPALWNGACDIAVNLILSKFSNIGKRPKTEAVIEKFEKMIAEEIYERLLAEGDGGEQKDIEESDYSKPEDGGDSEDLDALLVQALSMAKADAAVSEGFLLEIEEIIKPDIRFDDVFKEYLSVSLFEKIQSFTRPNRRYIHKNIYLPGYERPKEHLTLYIAIDSSMSVGDEEYRRFLGAASSVAQSFSEYTITVVPFDSKINSSLVFRLTSGEPFSEEAFKIPKTDGGTDIEPFFEYAENDPEFGADSVLAVLTDGFFEMPRTPPAECVFFVSERKNLGRFEDYGKTIWLGI